MHCTDSVHFGSSVNPPGRFTFPFSSNFASVETLAPSHTETGPIKERGQRIANKREKRTEECVRERDSLDSPRVEILHYIRVQVEEDGHIHRLASGQPLLLEAETLNLGEVRRHLRRCDAVRRHANDVAIALVRCRVEGQSRLAGEYLDFALLRDELPGEYIRDGGVESDADAFLVRQGYEPFREGCRVLVVVGDVGAVGAHWLTSPPCGLADLQETGKRG